MNSSLDRKESKSKEKLWQLICQSRKGDEKAFEELIRLRREPIFWLAFQMLGNEESAKEIAQLTFIRLWKALKKFKQVKSFDFWLRRMVINLCLDELRKKKREREAISMLYDREKEKSLPELRAGEAAIFKDELQNIFIQLSGELAPRQKAAFILTNMHGLSSDEAAKIMRCSTSTVRNQVMLARRFLRKQLERYYPEYIKNINKRS